MKELKLTLYEVFGLTLPGAVFAFGLVVLYWAIFFPKEPADGDPKKNELLVTVLAVSAVLFSYICGHVTQAIGRCLAERLYGCVENLVINGTTTASANQAKDATSPPTTKSDSDTDKGDSDKLPSEIVEACRTLATTVLNGNTSHLPAYWLFQICDDVVVRSGKIGEREVYIYREGFCRGASVGFGMLSFALLCLLCRLACTGRETVGTLGVTFGNVLFALASSTAMMYFLWNRYFTFSKYRIINAMIGSLTLHQQEHEEEVSEHE
jgi:hypothetical protein